MFATTCTLKLNASVLPSTKYWTEETLTVIYISHKHLHLPASKPLGYISYNYATMKVDFKIPSCLQSSLQSSLEMRLAIYI